MRKTRLFGCRIAWLAVPGLLLLAVLACGFADGDEGLAIPEPQEPTPSSTSTVPEVPDPEPGGSAPIAVLSAPNVILIIADALRADHVSAYGYARPTTPNLDAIIADQGVIFTNSVSASSWTYPSNAAMLTGRDPPSIGVVWRDHDSSIPAEEVMLAEYMHDAGYYTAGFVSAKWTRADLGFDQGFDVYQERIGAGADQTRAEEINDMARTWLSNTWSSALSGTQPLFLYLYYFDPHTWYNPPSPYYELYDPAYTGTLEADVYQNGIPVSSGAITPTARDVEHLIALYDGDITYWDYHLGEMLAYLDDLHLLDNSLVILTSDHGQMFGEHGKWTHRNSLYEEVLRVPLLIRYIGAISAGHVVSAPVYALDIVPSILDWVDIPIPDSLRGMSLRALAQGEPMTGTGTLLLDRPTFSAMDEDAINDPDWFAPDHKLRAVRRGNWKYIHHIGIADSDELYQLHPVSLYETENMLEMEPEIADALFQELIHWFDIPTVRTYLPYAGIGNAPAVAWFDQPQ